jgi:hypothetical protein
MGKDRILDSYEKEHVWVTVFSPDLAYRYNTKFCELESCDNKIRFEIFKEDLIGEWEIYFLNDISNPPVYIDYDIYRMI